MKTSPLLLVFAFSISLAFAPSTLKAQFCPSQTSDGASHDSAPLAIHGLINYHEDQRQWIGLQLDQPACGQTEIQLLATDGGAFEVDKSNSQGLETYRGCRAVVSGTLGLSGTGYYSADIYQNVTSIVADPFCIRQPPFPDFSNAKPNPRIRQYRVSIALNKAFSVHVKSANHLLAPWQAYASYQLTGGFALYGECAGGFNMSRVSGSPESRPWQIEIKHSAIQKARQRRK